MTSRADVFREWFGVRPSAGRVVDALYAAGGKVVTHRVLLDASGQTKHGVDLSIKLLRAAMDPGSIVNEPGEGYRLSLMGLRDCDDALEDAVRRTAEERAA